MPTQARLSIIKARPREREILTQAAGRLQQIVNSLGFAFRVLPHRWHSRPRFVGALGLDNAGVLRVLRTGREDRRPVTDFDRSGRRPFSVPYAVGDIVEGLHGSR